MDASTSGLAERLGHAADAKLLIISCDDLGSCHAANEGVYAALRDGVATCASLMVPACLTRAATFSLSIFLPMAVVTDFVATAGSVAAALLTTATARS